MAKFGKKPRTICKHCGKEIGVGGRTKHLEEEHPELKNKSVSNNFDYPAKSSEEEDVG
jgi:hypothetical protein